MIMAWDYFRTGFAGAIIHLKKKKKKIIEQWFTVCWEVESAVGDVHFSSIFYFFTFQLIYAVEKGKDGVFKTYSARDHDHNMLKWWFTLAVNHG